MVLWAKLTQLELWRVPFGRRRFFASLNDNNQSNSPTKEDNQAMTITRRSFLAASAATVVAARSASFAAANDVNSRIGVCTIGFNGQGTSHIKDILKKKNEAEYVALCDT